MDNQPKMTLLQRIGWLLTLPFAKLTSKINKQK
jgi:hypothetical protein